MKQVLIPILITLFGSAAFAQSTSDQILGEWTNPDQDRILEFVKNDSAYDAIIRHADPSSLIGKTQISALVYDEDNAYVDGILHVLQKDRIATCSVQLVSGTEMELSVRYGIMSRSQVWTKLESNQSKE